MKATNRLTAFSRPIFDSTFGNIHQLALMLIEAAADGGGTFHMSGHERPTTGYAVANLRGELILSGRPTAAVVEAWLDTVVRESAGGTFEHVGVWRDAETGKVHFDCVAIMSDERGAIALGRQMRQLAIFNLYTGSEVRL